MKDLKVGDLVTCRLSYPFARQLGLYDRIGIALEIRRDNSRIFYDTMGHSFWLPVEFVKKAELPDTEKKTLLKKLNTLLTLVNAAECEFEPGESAHRLAAYIELITHQTIDKIKTYLGEDLINLVIHAHGMTQMIIQIDFK